MERLLLVGGTQLGGVARRRDRLVGGERHAGGVLRADARVVAERREGRGDDPLRGALVGDVGDVIDLEAAAAFGDEQIFAAHLQALRGAAGLLVDVGELLDRMRLARPLAVEGLAAPPVAQLALVAVDMRLEEIGIGIFVQIGADHRLRLAPFGDAHRLETLVEPDPGVQPDEIDEVGALQQQLRHDRIVVVGLRQMAVAAGLGLGLPHRVREVRRERLAREARRRDRRLLHIDALAVDVGRRQDQRRGRAHRRDDVALGGLVPAELEHLVARHLRIIGREIARRVAVVFVPRRLPVRLDRQVAAAARGRPRQMAGVAGHLAVLVRPVGGGDAGPELIFAGLRAGLRHQLRPRRDRVEVGVAAVDGVLHQRHVPFDLGIHDRTLDQRTPSALVDPFETATAVGVADQRQVGTLRPRRRARGLQRREGVRGAVAVLAADLHRVGDLAIDIAVAVAVLREVAVGALHALFGVDIHQMDGLARVDAGRDELGLVALAPFLGVVVGDDLALGIEQIALAVALQDGAEIPAVAVIVGELRVLELGIEVVDVAQEVDVGPFAQGRGALGVAVVDLPDFLGGRIFLLLGPHVRRVGFIVPHRVAEVGVHEHVRLVHVAVHALRGRDGAREHMLDRMALFILRDRRICSRGLAVAAVLRPGHAVPRLTVVGVDDVAGAAARGAIVAGLVVGAHEPGEGVVEARLVDVDHRHRDAQARAGAAVRLADVGPARLLDALDRAGGVGQADLGELRADVAPAALEHAEDVARRNRVPARDRIELGQRAARLGLGREFARLHPRRSGRGQLRRLALRRIGLAEDVVLIRQDAVVVGGAAQEHRAGRHQRALGRLDDLHVAGAAGLPCHAIVRRVHEAHELGRFLVEERVADLGVGGARIMPALGIARQHVRRLAQLHIFGALRVEPGRRANLGLAAVAVGAAEHDGGRQVHRIGVGLGVAGQAAGALGVGLRPGLVGRGRRRDGIFDVARLLALGGDQLRRADGGRHQQHRPDRPAFRPSPHRAHPRRSGSR